MLLQRMLITLYYFSTYLNEISCSYGSFWMHREQNVQVCDASSLLSTGPTKAAQTVAADTIK